MFTARVMLLAVTALVVAAGTVVTAASAQAPERQSGPAYSKRFFTTALEKDAARNVQMQMQLSSPLLASANRWL